MHGLIFPKCFFVQAKLRREEVNSIFGENSRTMSLFVTLIFSRTWRKEDPPFEITRFYICIKYIYYIYIYINMYIYIYIYRERLSREKTRFNKPRATQVLILLKIPQQTFQRRFNVVFRLIWCRDVALP